MKILVLTQLHEENKKKIEEAFPQFIFQYSSRKTVSQKMVDECDVIIGNPNYHIEINRPNIKAILLNSAGSDRYVQEGILNKQTRLANASGVHSDAMAEHTIGMILSTNKHFRNYFEHMKNHQWQDEGEGKEMIGSTVVIVGLGDIGYQIAKRLKVFGCHIIGIKRSYSKVPECIDELYTVDQLDRVLPLADYIISCLPHTQETIHLFNEERFRLMKDDASFINVGRGSAVDTTALKKILDENKLFAVCLDVFEQEPLDANDCLWDYPNVFITPHVSGSYVWKSTRDHFTELVIRNINHLINNEELENEVDFQTGYRKKVTYR